MDDARPSPPSRRPAFAALAGLLAAAAGLASAELAAVAVRPESSPVTAVGEAVIDRTPPAVKEWAIATFGTADKLALQCGIVLLLALYAAGLGLLTLARRVPGRPLAAAGALAFGAVGAAAAWSRPDAQPSDAGPSLLGSVIAAVVLLVLARRIPGTTPAGDADDAPATGRRAFLVAAATATAASAGGGALARTLRGAETAQAEAARTAVRLPAPDSPAPPLPRAAPAPRRPCPAAPSSACAASTRTSPPTTASTASTPRCRCPTWTPRRGN